MLWMHKTYFLTVLDKDAKEVQELLQNPAIDINKPYEAGVPPIPSGYTALHIAAAFPSYPESVADKKIALLQSLLTAGAQVNAIDNEGRSALFYARTPERAKVLLQHGADTSIQDKYGLTPVAYLGWLIALAPNKIAASDKQRVQELIKQYLQASV